MVAAEKKKKHKLRISEGRALALWPQIGLRQRRIVVAEDKQRERGTEHTGGEGVWREGGAEV